METRTKITVEYLTDRDLVWFVETAAVNMLTHEVKRPDLVDLPTLYDLAIRGLDMKTAFIAKQGDIPVGALGAILNPSLYNSNKMVLSEVFWYILPEFRQGRAGYLLLEMFDKEAKNRADDASLSLLSSSVVNTSSLSKRGYQLVEYGFMKRMEE